MRATTELFKVNGMPLLLPDEEITVSYEDMDGPDAGRDESGVMHRKLVRSKVAAWKFSYSSLTEAEKQYMEQLFGDGATFSFTHPSRLCAQTPETTKCYRSQYSITWKNARTGLWSNYSFRIIQC